MNPTGLFVIVAGVAAFVLWPDYPILSGICSYGAVISLIIGVVGVNSGDR
jgi:hypothetical protein